MQEKNKNMKKRLTKLAQISILEIATGPGFRWTGGGSAVFQI